MNATIFWTTFIRRQRTASSIPLFGGALGALSFQVLPIAALKDWWWLPPLFDWGCVPGIAYALIFHAVRYVREN
ncbi:hypothetical protein EON80_05990 [bacterium]|nr:MAG: hypothetical protein EON80_05990 [bacterium]